MKWSAFWVCSMKMKLLVNQADKRVIQARLIHWWRLILFLKQNWNTQVFCITLLLFLKLQNVSKSTLTLGRASMHPQVEKLSSFSAPKSQAALETFSMRSKSIAERILVDKIVMRNILRSCFFFLSHLIFIQFSCHASQSIWKNSSPQLFPVFLPRSWDRESVLVYLVTELHGHMEWLLFVHLVI